ncbi:EAL domain-containing protein [Salsuginibacillus kocurii]|uniref:EAL domain-containing protein n=1 Tax=Salsuginibacillus kocurii TaxID=427078 RepID=UPI00035C979C|nr:EAL domain-containing protein [Salsuginibacillus kocurii]
MDALDIVMNKDQIFPYYQPILSADRHTIMGYEVLGRIMQEDEPYSLGGFFQDEGIPEEYHLEVDEWIQVQALEAWAQQEDPVKLFFNIYPFHFIYDRGEALIERMESYQTDEHTIEQIVFDIREQDLFDESSGLKAFLQYVKSLGIQVAIDNVRPTGDSLERLVQLEPDILKVDMGAFNEDTPTELYREMLHSITMLSRKMGASLLFERVRSFQQLNVAWRHGARYYQGYYLQKPRSTWLEANALEERLHKDFYYFMDYERKKIEAQMALSETLAERVSSVLKNVETTTDYETLTLSIAEELSDLCFRIYICNADGIQESGNAYRTSDGWAYNPKDKDRNWSWRPYFLENIMRMAYEGKGILSDLYTDIHINERIRTYSYPIKEEAYLFLDIPYDVLFERDYLL